MQCNLKCLGYFYVLQDMETLKQSHTCILGICAYWIHFVWRSVEEVYGRAEKDNCL